MISAQKTNTIYLLDAYVSTKLVMMIIICSYALINRARGPYEVYTRKYLF